MTAPTLVLNRFQALLFGLSSQLLCFGPSSCLCSLLRPSPLLNFLLNLSQFLHLSLILLLLHYVENLVVWLTWFIDLISIILNLLSLGCEQFLKLFQINLDLTLHIRIASFLPLPNTCQTSSQVIAHLFIRLTLHVDLLSVRFHVIHDHILRCRLICIMILLIIFHLMLTFNGCGSSVLSVIFGRFFLLSIL